MFLKSIFGGKRRKNFQANPLSTENTMICRWIENYLMIYIVVQTTGKNFGSTFRRKVSEMKFFRFFFENSAKTGFFDFFENSAKNGFFRFF